MHNVVKLRACRLLPRERNKCTYQSAAFHFDAPVRVRQLLDVLFRDGFSHRVFFQNDCGVGYGLVRGAVGHFGRRDKRWSRQKRNAPVADKNSKLPTSRRSKSFYSSTIYAVRPYPNRAVFLSAIWFFVIGSPLCSVTGNGKPYETVGATLQHCNTAR